MEDRRDAEDAMQELNNTEFMGNKIRCEIAKPDRNPPRFRGEENDRSGPRGGGRDSYRGDDDRHNGPRGYNNNEHRSGGGGYNHDRRGGDR